MQKMFVLFNSIERTWQQHANMMTSRHIIWNKRKLTLVIIHSSDVHCSTGRRTELLSYESRCNIRFRWASGFQHDHEEAEQIILKTYNVWSTKTALKKWLDQTVRRNPNVQIKRENGRTTKTDFILYQSDMKAF